MKDVNAYTDFLTRWFKARKETPADISIGPEPDPKDFGFTNEMEKWEANKIRTAVQKEMARNS